VFVWRLARQGVLDIKHDKGTREYEIEAGRLKIVSKVMMAGNDVQIGIGGFTPVYEDLILTNYRDGSDSNSLN
jgi:hypothetical protein